MVQLTITHPTPLTSSNLQENLFDYFNRSLFHPNVDFPIIHTHRFIVSFPIDSRLTSTPPCPTPALVSNIYNVFISNPFRQVPFSFFTYYYHLRHNSPHTRTTFLFYVWYSNVVTTFETNPYPQQYHFQGHSATAQQQKHIDMSVRFL